MTFPYLYTILTCVSSEAQAEDRASLDDQLANAKRYGDNSGGMGAAAIFENL